MMETASKGFSTAVALSVLLVFLIASAVQADLVLHFDFEEDDANRTAGNVVDRSDFGNDGTVESGWAGYDLPSYTTSHDDSNAMLFGYDDVNGAGYAWNSVRVPKSNSLVNVGTKWSMAFWVRCDSTVGSSGNLHHYPKIISCPNYEVILHSTPDADPYSYFWPWDEYGEPEENWNFAMAETDSYEDQWIHIAVTYDGATFTQYIDGNSVFTKNDFDHQFDTTTWNKAGAYWVANPLRIAAHSDGNSTGNGYLIGALDDVAVWNQCLDTDGVAEVMDGNFAGPWAQAVYESDQPTTFIWDSSFIAQKDTIFLDFGQKRKGGTGVPSWNWQVGGDLSDPNYYGLVNAGLVDGNALSIEYAAYTTVDTNILQPKATEYGIHDRIHKDTKYDFRARFAGENAINNVIGVKFYAADVNEDPSHRTLLADLSQTIAANGTWYELSTTFTADEVNYPDTNMTFLVECYVNQGTGNPRGTGFGWFDYVRVDVNEFLTCAAYIYYHGGNPELPYDFVEDCRIDFKDYAEIAGAVADENPEPSIEAGELLSNPDFYEDINKVPDYLDFTGTAPTGWSFDPTPTEVNQAGIWNRDRDGLVIFDPYKQPAGGSVVVYIDPNHILKQVVSSPIVLGQKYYLSAMIAGDATGGVPYLAMVHAILEYVDDPVTEANAVQVAEANFVLPIETPVWRVITADEYTADTNAAGKYLRAKLDFGPNPVVEDTNVYGLALIGNASLTTTKPSVWPRENLLTNGDFEDFSSLPVGTPGDKEGWINLFDYVANWTEDSVPGWTTTAAPGYYGLQCMLWVPAPQPAYGRASAWFDSGDTIAQKVTSEAIQVGTYYLDFIAAINAGGYQTGTMEWPGGEPNLVVKVHWTDGDDLSGTEDVNYGLITTLMESVNGPLVGSGQYNVPYGGWALPETSFQITGAPEVGKSFYVVASCDVPDADYAYFEEIYLSKEPRLDIGAYTCYELQNILGETLEGDLDGDCDVDVEDIVLFVDDWLECNDPQGCN